MLLPRTSQQSHCCNQTGFSSLTIPVLECCLQSRQCEVGGSFHSHPSWEQLEHQLPLRQCEQFIQSWKHPELNEGGEAHTVLFSFLFSNRRTAALPPRTIKQKMPVQIQAKVRNPFYFSFPSRECRFQALGVCMSSLRAEPAVAPVFSHLPSLPPVQML